MIKEDILSVRNGSAIVIDNLEFSLDEGDKILLTGGFRANIVDVVTDQLDGMPNVGIIKNDQSIIVVNYAGYPLPPVIIQKLLIRQELGATLTMYTDK